MSSGQGRKSHLQDVGAYLMGLPHNFGQTQHFDTLVVFASGALALSRAGDACSFDGLIAAARGRSLSPPPDDGEYRWPIRFVWVAMALIFCAAGVSKLRHSGLEWIFSDNLEASAAAAVSHLGRRTAHTMGPCRRAASCLRAGSGVPVCVD